MLNGVYLFIGGRLGTPARWGAAGFAARPWSKTFPPGALAVNVAGSFIIGLFTGLNAVLSLVPCLGAVWPSHLPALCLNSTKGN